MLDRISDILCDFNQYDWIISKSLNPISTDSMNPTSSECFGTLQTACLSVACGGSSARPSEGLLGSLPQRLPSVDIQTHQTRPKDFRIWVLPKIGVFPQNGWWKSWKTLLKWMIWGYHYFWKHPYRKQICLAFMNLFHYGTKSIYW